MDPGSVSFIVYDEMNGIRLHVVRSKSDSYQLDEINSMATQWK